MKNYRRRFKRLKGNEKVAIINGRFNHIITDRLVEVQRIHLKDMVEMKKI